MVLYANFVQLLRNGGWNFMSDSSEGRVTLVMNTKTGRYPVIIPVWEESKFIIAMMPFPRKVAPALRRKMAQFMSKSNFTIPLGGSEMDPEDGEMRFRNSIDVESLVMTTEFIDNFVRTFASFGSRCWRPAEMILEGRSVQEAYDAVT
jgi:hypothetical protein